MDDTANKVNRILQQEHEKMRKYLKYYLKLPGVYAGKIRINKQYLQENIEEIRRLPDAYPTRLAYMTDSNPTEYNNKYPHAVEYENMKAKAYQVLYLEERTDKTGYDEDIGFNIGLELILKEYVDNHPQFKELIKIKE